MEENSNAQSVNNIDSTGNKPLIHNFKEGGMLTPKVISLLVLMVILGALSGYLFSGKSTQTVSNKNTIQDSKASSGTVVGSNDTKTFKDTVEGTLKEGGIEGEGAFHLVRPGGASQNVYLTSSIVDLSQYLGKKIRVWGQTQKAQYAGWLMDVGKIEVL